MKWAIIGSLLLALVPATVSASVAWEQQNYRNKKDCPVAATQYAIPKGAEVRVRVIQVGKADLILSGWDPKYHAPLPADGSRDGNKFDPIARWTRRDVTEGEVLKMTTPLGGAGVAIWALSGRGFFEQQLTKNPDGKSFRVMIGSGWVVDVKVAADEEF